jgi:hypothetical protein
MTADSIGAATLDDLVADAAEEPEDERLETDILLEGVGDVYEKGFVTLSNGHRLPLRQLKAKQLFVLMRIITRGGFQLVPTLLAGMGTWTPAEFANQLIALTVWAVPEAPEATLEFLRTMVDFPVNEEGNLTEQGKEDVNLLVDPEMEDVVEIITAIVMENKDDLVSLGKKMRSAMEVMKKTGQLKNPGSEGSSDLTLVSSI